MDLGLVFLPQLLYNVGQIEIKGDEKNAS